MRVFLSSTYVDLIEYRNKATEALQRLGQDVGRMEIFGAMPEEPQAASLAEVERCDLFVGIYAHRYGYIAPGSDISITEAELEQAKALDKPLFCFFVDDTHPWPPLMIEDNPGRSKLTTLKNRLQTAVVRAPFTTPDDLAATIATSMASYLLRSLTPVVSGLRDTVENHSSVSAASRQKVVEAIAATVEIANRTFAYIALRRQTEPPQNSDEQRLQIDQWQAAERLLSQGWAAAGNQLISLENPPVDLADRFFIKAQYWADPEVWNDERVEAARIRLDEVAAESRRILLGQIGDNNQSPTP